MKKLEKHLSASDIKDFEAISIQRYNGFVQVQAIVLLPFGENVSDVARQFHCLRNTTIDLLQRFQQTESVKDAA